VDVVVVGGGIAGLAAAWSVCDRAPAAAVTVLEATSQVGGKLRVASVAGRSVDVGAEAMLTRRPEALDLSRAAGLGDDLVDAATTSASVYAAGALYALPAGTLMGVPFDVAAARASGLLSASSLSAIEDEPTRPGLPPLAGDVGVGQLVRDRLGDEVVDRLVEPLLAGVYAGRADRISLQAALPALAAQLREGGSLVAAARAAAAPGGGDGGGAGSAVAGSVFAAITGGVGRLPAALAASGRFTVRTGVTVRSIRRTPVGFELDCGPVPRTERVGADAVIVAVPPAKAAGVLRAVAPGAATELAAIETASVAIVTLAYTDARLPSGSGLLVGAQEGLAVKGVTLTSQKWPGWPPGLMMLRASIGRVGETRDLQRSDDELVALVRGELRTLLGITAAPIDVLVTRWGGGLPQYGIGHVNRVARIRRAVATVPGLAVCGAAYDGLGIPACIGSAHAAAAQACAAFAQTGQ
jgi:protoporphyrinogen/coproporphyrinogen III oxidase